MYLVVWSAGGTPLWASTVSFPATGGVRWPSLHSTGAVLQLNLQKVGEMIVGLSRLTGTTRIQRLTLALPIEATHSQRYRVDVVVCVGSLCCTGIIMFRQDISNVLDHPFLHLALMALSLLEPAWGGEESSVNSASNNKNEHGGVINPLARPMPVTKSTPPNSANGINAITPAAPRKPIAPTTSDDPLSPPRVNAVPDVLPTRGTLPSQIQNRWHIVVPFLIQQCTSEDEARKRNEAFCGRDVLRERSQDEEQMQMLQHLVNQAPLSELHITLSSLVAWYQCNHFVISRSVAIIKTILNTSGSALRVDEPHFAVPDTMTNRRIGQWIRSDPEECSVQWFTQPNRSASKSIAAHRNVDPVCMPLCVPLPVPECSVVCAFQGDASLDKKVEHRYFVVIAPPSLMHVRSFTASQNSMSSSGEETMRGWNDLVKMSVGGSPL